MCIVFGYVPVCMHCLCFCKCVCVLVCALALCVFAGHVTEWASTCGSVCLITRWAGVGDWPLCVCFCCAHDCVEASVLTPVLVMRCECPRLCICVPSAWRHNCRYKACAGLDLICCLKPGFCFQGGGKVKRPSRN